MMRQLGTFDLNLDDRTLSRVMGSKKKIPVEVLVDPENTIVLLDCSCCPDLLASKLPGGALIPIVSSLKTFFESIGMRNIDVVVDGDHMKRTYRGVIDEELLDEMKEQLVFNLAEFLKKRKAA